MAAGAGLEPQTLRSRVDASTPTPHWPSISILISFLKKIIIDNVLVDRSFFLILDLVAMTGLLLDTLVLETFAASPCPFLLDLLVAVVERVDGNVQVDGVALVDDVGLIESPRS